MNHSLLLLSWDPKSCTTSGIYVYRDSRDNQLFLIRSRALGSQARIPMALILLLFVSCIEAALREIGYGRNSVKTVEARLEPVGMKPGAYGLDDNDLPADYSSAHQRLVNASRLLDNSSHQFLYALTDSIACFFNDLPRWTLWPTDPRLNTDLMELEDQYCQLQQTVSRMRSDGDCSIRRIDLLMKVVSVMYILFALPKHSV